MTRARAKRWARALGVLALFVLAFWLTGCDPAVFWARRAHLRDIAAQLFPPDWSYLSAIVAPLLATLRMSVTGTALGVALALGFAPLCAHNLPCPAPVRAVLRFLVQVLRSFPALILGAAGDVSVRPWHVFRHGCHHGLYACGHDAPDL